MVASADVLGGADRLLLFPGSRPLSSAPHGHYQESLGIAAIGEGLTDDREVGAYLLPAKPTEDRSKGVSQTFLDRCPVNNWKSVLLWGIGVASLIDLTSCGIAATKFGYVALAPRSKYFHRGIHGKHFGTGNPVGRLAIIVDVFQQRIHHSAALRHVVPNM